MFISEEQLDKNINNNIDENENPISVAFELLDKSENIYNFAFENLYSIDRVLNNYYFKQQLGERLLGIESFYSSNHISLEGFIEFMGKIVMGILNAFKNLFIAIWNKLKAFGRLFTKGAISKEKKEFKKTRGESQEAWNANADKAEIVSYDYTKAFINPVQDSGASKDIINCMSDVKSATMDITRKANSFEKDIKNRLSGDRSKSIENIKQLLDELCMLISSDLVKGFNKLIDTNNKYYVVKNVEPIRATNYEEFNRTVTLVKNATKAFSLRKTALRLVLNDTSGKLSEKKRMKVNMAFKDYSQILQILMSDQAEVGIGQSTKITLNMIKSDIAEFKKYSDKIENAFNKYSAGNVSAKEYIQKVFKVGSSVGSLCVSLLGSVGTWANNMYIHQLIKIKTAKNAINACKNYKS